MPAVFVHVSDIHFGQEKGSETILQDDVRDCLVKDAARLAKKYCDGQVTGIIVTGDVAYAGKSHEYVRAATWLDKLTDAVGCKRTDVLVVPGNHDIDRSAISSGCKLMLEQILDVGEKKLDEFLANELDREVLYGRFVAYRPFAEGYDCPMANDGGPAFEKRLELVPGRFLRFIGLNSALVCSAADKEGILLLGNRQRIWPRTDGEEVVVLTHHPLNWLRDSELARQYIRSRARVLISGHEHNPKLAIENIKDGSDFLTLAAGATTPDVVNEHFTYTYNFILFDWDEETDGLKVTVVPRAWSAEDTDFEQDEVRLGGHEPVNILQCPNFRLAAPVENGVNVEAADTLPSAVDGDEAPARIVFERDDVVADIYPLVLLRFFRDLTATQRAAVLLELKALPLNWRDPLTQSIERSLIDSLARAGKLEELSAAMEKFLNQ